MPGHQASLDRARQGSLPRRSRAAQQISDLVVKQQPSAFSRHEMPERCMIHPPEKHKGAGNAGYFAHTRSLAWKSKKPHELVTQVRRNIPAFPARWFTAYFVLSPVIGLFCDRRLQVKPANLTPASGRQDHTTSPYASAPFVERAICAQAPPRPLAIRLSERHERSERKSLIWGTVKLSIGTIEACLSGPLVP
jgi:hypothetical protein